jgi:hypothetical protein
MRTGPHAIILSGLTILCFSACGLDDGTRQIDLADSYIVDTDRTPFG